MSKKTIVVYPDIKGQQTNEEFILSDIDIKKVRNFFNDDGISVEIEEDEDNIKFILSEPPDEDTASILVYIYDMDKKNDFSEDDNEFNEDCDEDDTDRN